MCAFVHPGAHPAGGRCALFGGDACAAGVDHFALGLGRHVDGAFGVAAAVAHHLVTALAKGRRHLRVVVVDGGVQQRGGGQRMFVQRFQQVPHAHAVAPVTPGVVDDVGLGLARIELRAQAFTKRKGLHVDGDVHRQPAPPGQA
jgi:hypothetical protein